MLGKLYIIRKTFYALIHLYVLMYVNVGYNKAHIIFAFEVKLRTNSLKKNNHVIDDTSLSDIYR